MLKQYLDLMVKDRLKTIGKRCRYWRMKRKVSLDSVAVQLGFPVSKLRKFECGCLPTVQLDFIIRVSAVLGIEFGTLMADFVPEIDCKLL